jgi:hypothetical protein
VAAILLSALAGLVFLVCAGAVFLKWGWKSFYPVGALSLAAGVAAAWAGQRYLAEYLTVVLAPVIIGTVAGMTFRIRRTLQFFLLVTPVALAIVFTANYYFLKVYKNTDLIQESRQRIVEMVNAAALPESEKREFMARVEESLEMVRDIVPFTYFLNALIGSLVCFLLLRVLLERFSGKDTAVIAGMELFKLNDYFIFVLIFGWLIVLLADRSAYYPLYVAGLNCALSFSVLYLLQAMGIAKYYMNKKGVPPFILPLVLLMILFLGMEVALFVSIIMLSVGALDFWADFRKLEAQSKKQV